MWEKNKLWFDEYEKNYGENSIMKTKPKRFLNSFNRGSFCLKFITRKERIALLAYLYIWGF